MVLSGISPSFDGLSRTPRQVVHVLLTRSPVYSLSCPNFLPRLACLRHAASVRSEPGSNSPYKLSISTGSRGLTRKADGLTALKFKESDRLQIVIDLPPPNLGMHYYSVFKDPPANTVSSIFGFWSRF